MCDREILSSDFPLSYAAQCYRGKESGARSSIVCYRRLEYDPGNQLAEPGVTAVELIEPPE